MSIYLWEGEEGLWSNKSILFTSRLVRPTGQEAEDTEHIRICKMMSICIAHSANTGGLGSLTGTGPNVVFKGQSEM